MLRSMSVRLTMGCVASEGVADVLHATLVVGAVVVLVVIVVITAWVVIVETLLVVIVPERAASSTGMGKHG